MCVYTTAYINFVVDDCDDEFPLDELVFFLLFKTLDSFFVNVKLKNSPIVESLKLQVTIFRINSLQNFVSIEFY